MIVAEFELIQRKLDTAFSMLHDDDSIRLWFNNLKDFDYCDVDASVSAFIYSNNRRPTIGDIVNGAKQNRARRTRPPEIQKSKTVRCPYCKDTGLIFTHYRYTSVAHPCTECDLGRITHPWDFKTDEEKEECIREEEKRGLRPPRVYHEAPKEYYLDYIAGKI